jgi:lipopolysaccharide transport system permease protein
VFAALVDFSVSFVVLIGDDGLLPHSARLEQPVAAVDHPAGTLTALAVGLWLSALNVQYRDVQHMVPFIIQVWMYASPIVYPIETIPEGIWRCIIRVEPHGGCDPGLSLGIVGRGSAGYHHVDLDCGGDSCW